MKKVNNETFRLTAREKVYSYLKEKILDLHMKPGEIINISKLESYLGLSRSPIRDALIQLENEGLVTTIPKKGTAVTKINSNGVNDERFLRSCIEGKVTIEFLDICNKTHISELHEAMRQQKEAIDNNDFRTFLRKDDYFHSILYKATNHLYCLDIVQNLSGNYYRLRLLSLADPKVMLQTYDIHLEMMELIENKDKQKLYDLVHYHITDKDEEVNTLVYRFPDLFTGMGNTYLENNNIFENDFLKSRFS